MPMSLLGDASMLCLFHDSFSFHTGKCTSNPLAAQPRDLATQDFVFIVKSILDPFPSKYLGGFVVVKVALPATDLDQTSYLVLWR